jgi:hypothetical protein
VRPTYRRKGEMPAVARTIARGGLDAEQCARYGEITAKTPVTPVLKPGARIATKDAYGNNPFSLAQTLEGPGSLGSDILPA